MTIRSEVADALDAVPAHLVTIIRDPYDAFVSTYYTLQQHSADDNQKGRKFTELMGKPLDDPAVIEFLRNGGYRNNLEKAATGRGAAAPSSCAMKISAGIHWPSYDAPPADRSGQ